VRLRIATLALILFVATPAVAGAASSQDTPWQPDMKAARDYAHHRRGIIAFEVRTEQHQWGYNDTRTMPSASVIKAMLLVAYLDLPGVQGRALRANERSILGPMIRRSDDGATNHVFSHVGYGGLKALARRVGMSRFKTDGHWGRSSIDAADQGLFLLHIDQYIVARHRAYAMKLLSEVIPPERWGIAQVRPRGWTLYFKGGWGAGTGWVDHQVALLTRGSARVALVILTHFDPSHAYGKATLRGLAARLLRGLSAAQTIG
jgi:beta-lactamase class A